MREDCVAIAKRVAAQVGPVSILVNNAGINRRNAFTGEPSAVFKDWDDIIAINLNGTFNVTHAFLDALRATKGRIVNIGSIQSFVHVRTPNSPAYTTSKHGVLGFTRALAAELGKHGVRVNAIGPGLIETPLNAQVRANDPDLVQDFHGPHAAGTRRQARGHRGSGDLPRLRSLVLRDGIDRDGGRRLPGDLNVADGNRAIAAVIQPLLRNSLGITGRARRWRTTQSAGRDERGRRAPAGDRASRDVPDRRAIPDGPDPTVRAARPDHRASRGRRASAAKPVRRANRGRRASPAKPVRRANRGRKAPGEPGPPGQLPSIEQVMPWLHLLFDAWEDYKRLREREALEAAEREASVHEALALDEHGEMSDEDEDDKEHRKKKRQDKDKHKK